MSTLKTETPHILRTLKLETLDYHSWMPQPAKSMAIPQPAKSMAKAAPSRYEVFSTGCQETHQPPWSLMSFHSLMIQAWPR